MRLHTHPVRFGDVSVGGVMHYSKAFDLAIRSLEELTGSFETTISDIVDDGGVPYAPVDVRGSFGRYPRIGEVVTIEGSVLEVSEKHFLVEYEYETSEGPLGQMRMAHITVAPGGGASPLAPPDRLALEDRLIDEVPADDPLPGFESVETTGVSFETPVMFHSPYIEAAGLGYIEDYFGFVAGALENHLAARGAQVGRLEPALPFAPTEWTFEFPCPIFFEDDIVVRGDVIAVTTDAIDVQYAFTAATSPDDVRLHGRIRYECWDDSFRSVPFPDEARTAMQRD